MNDQELARVLIEKITDAKINKKISAYSNRLLLRLHSQPALLANLADFSASKPGIEGPTDDQVVSGEFHEDLAWELKAREEGRDPEKRGGPEEDDEDDDDSPVLIQLAFRRLPQEVLAPLLRLIAAPREPKLYRYIHNGQAMTGVEIEVKPSDFPGDDFDYSF